MSASSSLDISLRLMDGAETGPPSSLADDMVFIDEKSRWRSNGEAVAKLDGWERDVCCVMRPRAPSILDGILTEVAAARDDAIHGAATRWASLILDSFLLMSETDILFGREGGDCSRKSRGFDVVGCRGAVVGARVVHLICR